MTITHRSGVLSQFVCLGDKCEDTCCQNWSMQVDAETIARYRSEAPELMDAVEPAVESPWIMRKDASSGFCVKLEGGLCGIHKSYGDRFLGDACHFYPRVTRQLGDLAVMTATMSCPEITRLALQGAVPVTMELVDLERLPNTLKNYLPAGMAPAEALSIHQSFLDAVNDETASAEQILLRIASTSRSLERIDQKSWPAMVPFYLAHADTRIPAAEYSPVDPFNLLHALCGLIVASHKPVSDRLRQTLGEMEAALAVRLDWAQVQIETTDASIDAYRKMHLLWEEKLKNSYAPLLKKWLQMQISLALFPFSGLGNTLSERISIIGVRLAIIKLALSASSSINGAILSHEMVIRVVQSISRFLDHLGDAGFLIKICEETGWVKEARMRGLLNA